MSKQMIFDELEQHLAAAGFAVEWVDGPAGDTYLVIKDITIGAGRLAGRTCDVAILQSMENPWVPQAAIHVRPPLVETGSLNTQPSPLGSEWQYWSRRFDRPPTPRSFFAHILTVLGEP